MPVKDLLEEFPRQLARARRFSLGVPRSSKVSPDGQHVVLLRGASGGDPVSGLPLGGDLEYADVVTLSQALEGRREM